MPEAFVLPTATEGAPQLPELWTPTATPPVPPTATPNPTATIEMRIKEGTPMAEPTVLFLPDPLCRLLLLCRTERAERDKQYHFKSDVGCNWLGIAGQVFDLQGRPVKGIRVWVRGSLNGKQYDNLLLTLESSPYGPSGYEFTIADKPVNSVKNCRCSC